MREGWTYKKLGEVAKISSGKAIPSSDIIDTFSEGLYPCYGGNGLRGYVDHFSNDGLVPVIGRVGALCGNVHLPQGKFYATEHALVVYLKTKDKPHYIEYLLSSLNLRQYAKGVAQPVLSASTLSEITIPVPPLSEQQRIVSELDLLSSIIEKKKAQLKEYDQLAQSIFYDMFGDPVTNEKGWEVKKLVDCCKNCDSQRKPITAKDRIKGTIPYYGASGVVDFVKDYIFDGEYLLISEDGANLIIRSTPIAFRIKGKAWVNNHAHVLQFDALFKQIFIEYSINLRDISSIVTGCAQPKLTQAAMNNLNIPYPPLTLQQSFASKIEAIERQKALIQQSITEAETLFNSRMDFWFS